MKAFFLLFLITFLDITSIKAQTVNKKELELVRQQNFIDQGFEKRQVKFLLSKRKNPVIKYNPLSLAFGSLMFFYQKVLSHQFSTKCGYEISCSNFSKRVISEFGLIKGLALSADRLMRCTQFTVIDISVSDFNEDYKLVDNPEKYRLKN